MNHPMHTTAAHAFERSWRHLTILTAAALLIAPTGADGPYGELMIAESFAVSGGQLLTVDIPDGDVEVLAADGDQVDVKIYLKSRKMDRARERFEDMDFRVEQESDGVLIEAESHRRWTWGWGDRGGFHITVIVEAPRTFDAEIRTSDGDVRIEHLIGLVNLKTSDGDVRVDRLEGRLRLQTSDGDVRLREIDGKTEVETSDGDILAQSIRGEEIYFKTSDGDITFDELEAEEIEMRTSDGSIQGGGLRGRESFIHTSDGDVDLEGVGGALRAATSDGDVMVEIAELGETYIRSSGGDIRVYLPEGAGADLDLRGDRVRIPRTFSLDGRVDRREIDGRVNGGGPSLEVVAQDGEVSLRTRDEG